MNFFTFRSMVAVCGVGPILALNLQFSAPTGLVLSDYTSVNGVRSPIYLQMALGLGPRISTVTMYRTDT